jgi:hypothetical protein
VSVDDPNKLKWTVPVIFVFAAFMYVAGRRGLKLKDRGEYVRLIIPGLAFVAWTLVTGAPGLTLWGWFDWVRGMEAYVGVLVGGVALGLATLLPNPPPASSPPS